MTEFHVGDGVLRLVQGDITQVTADATVNAANSALAGGSGVDGAIHRAGGPSIMAECRSLGRCPTGSAVVTTAGNLPARVVIHAVAPVWRGGTQGEAELLASAYSETFRLGAEREARSIALPSLGTGAYGYPLEQAAPIALRAALDRLRTSRPPRHITFVLWDNRTVTAYKQAVEDLLATQGDDTPSEASTRGDRTGTRRTQPGEELREGDRQ
ncbi:MAG: macro domain-containing protein [Chloroflexia bacterium]|nr:macro domain-containing protein [Chloroflexia bacterium]